MVYIVCVKQVKKKYENSIKTEAEDEFMLMLCSSVRSWILVLIQTSLELFVGCWMWQIKAFKFLILQYHVQHLIWKDRNGNLVNHGRESNREGGEFNSYTRFKMTKCQPLFTADDNSQMSGLWPGTSRLAKAGADMLT